METSENSNISLYRERKMEWICTSVWLMIGRKEATPYSQPSIVFIILC